MKHFILSRIQKSIDVKRKVLNEETLLQTIESASQVIINSLQNGNKILFCGNGRSAANA